MMPLTDHPAPPSARAAEQPRWSVVLRALREARGVTQGGWAAHLSVSRKTIQRWEAGERAPDPSAEAAILSYCRERNLFRAFSHGSLAGFELTPDALHDLLAEARLDGNRRSPAGTGVAAGLQPARPDVRARPPNPSGLSPSGRSLPAALTSFVGREQELAAMRRMLGGTRLLTLVGAGGCGKTRLALALAEELLWAYPHGVHFVELAALADPELVPATAAAALGLWTTDERPVTELLVEALLRACPDLEVVITSREPLRIGGETLWRVPSLSLRGQTAAVVEADAVRLFVERAQQHRPDFALTAANEAAVVRICEQLDGIPLALELASACVKVLSAEQIAERLSDRFRLLTGGSRTALPRQQTLRATMDWSWDLLTAPEQALLRRLTVFAGGFTLEAAEAVGADAPDVLALLTALVDESLVIAEPADGVVRYRLLVTVRQYAAEKLDHAAETGSTRDRHLAWYLALAQAAGAAVQGPDEPAWLTRLEQEHDNLRAALAWSLAHSDDQGAAALRLAGSLARFWEVHGHMSEGRQWLAQALAAGGNAPADVRAKALEGAWWLAHMQGDYAEARAVADRCLTLYHDLGDALGIARAHGQLAGIALRSGGQSAACALMEKSLALSTEVGDTWGMAAAQCGLGLLALRQGDYAAARPRLEAGLALHRELGNKEGIANALDYLATVAGEQGDAEQQAALLAEALVLFRELGNKGGVALVLGDLGMTAWMQGDSGRALALLEESLALYRDRGEGRGIARVLGDQGLVALSQRDYTRAETLCRESLTLYRETGDAWGIGRYLPVLAGAAFGQGQAERAAQLFAAGAALRERLGTPLVPAVRLGHDRAVAAVRQVLGDEPFEAAWATGQALSPETAVAYALGDAEPAQEFGAAGPAAPPGRT